MPKEKILTKKNEIVEIIKKMHLFQSGINIYQKKGEKYLSSLANIEFVNLANGELVLRPTNIASNFEFKPKIRLYVTNRERTIKFISHIGNICSSKYLNIKIPDQIKQYNSRKNRRIYFDQREIRLNYTNSTNNNITDNLIQQSARLISFSEEGIGIICTSNKADEYLQNDKINFPEINNISQKSRIAGSIIYLQQLSPNYDCPLKHYSIGIKFDRKIAFSEFFKITNLNKQEFLTA